MPRGNKDKLIPQNQKTKQEQSRIAKLGGIKSGEVRQQQKTFKDVFKTLLNQDIPVGILPEEIVKISGEKINFRQAVALSMALCAIKGDSKAAIFVRDTIGEKPIDKQELEIKSFEIFISNANPKQIDNNDDCD